MGKRLSTEPVYKEIKDGRVTIPNNFCEAAGLPAESEKTAITLWLVRNGRYRLLAGDHTRHPEVEALRARIEEREGPASATEVDYNAYVVMNVRLVDTHLGGGKERRLSVPEIIANFLTGKKHGQVVVVLDGVFVEIWSIATFEATFEISTSELLG